MKKILSLVLAALMIFSVLPAAFAADKASEVSAEQEAAVQLLYDLQVYQGNANGDLGIDDMLERWMVANFMARLTTGKTDAKYWSTKENNSGFTDVNIGDFAGSAEDNLGMISYVAQAGIVNGTGDNKFSPTLLIKYKEAVTMVTRAAGYIYSDVSYPWAYMNTANNLGITAGIDPDIAPDDEINRGVMAQLMANALFVECKDGGTLAEKAFGVGQATVMVTATNDVVYSALDSVVLNTGKIRFAEVDAQCEPTGVSYHVDASLFGLADAKAANRAVGTLYNVYYINNYSNILSAESLAVKYENRGHDSIQVKYSNSTSPLYNQSSAWNGRYFYFITIDGSKYQIVDEFTNLSNNQGPTSDTAGDKEMKVFNDKDGSIDVASGYLKAGFVFSEDGKYIYQLTGNVADLLTPYAFYSDLLDCWYSVNNGNYQILNNSDLFETGYESSRNPVQGFNQVTAPATSGMAYADVIVNGNSTAIVREYRLGKITYATENRRTQYASSNTSKVATFMLQTYTGTVTSTDPLAYDTTSYTLYTNSSDTATVKYGYRPVGGNNYTADASDYEYYVDEYDWTGLAKSKVADGSYILYYVNHMTQELEILEVIDTANDGDDTYLVSGYIRGFDLASNTLTFGENYETYKFDYDTLSGGTLKSKSRNSSNTSGIDNYTYRNYNYLNGLYNIYVTLVVVDGKVVHIDSNSGSSEYVIIDNFVSFEENYILANAWSTVDNGYTQIKIRSFNGWSVGGVDYWYYFMQQYLNTAIVYNLPFTTYELYKVVSVIDGMYDLTDKGNVWTAQSTSNGTYIGLTANGYGFIEGVDKDGVMGAGKYYPTADSDYWMILDKYNGGLGSAVVTTGTAEDVVYSLNGKINKITIGTGAEVYKAKQDFVIVVDAAGDLTDANFAAGNIAYYKYNPMVNLYDNADYLVSNSFNSYNYSLYMTNALTGEVESVQLGNNSLLGTQGYTAYQMYQMLRNGAIYKAEDGVITDVTAIYSVADVATYYATTAQYDAIGLRSTPLAAGTSWDSAVKFITDTMVAELMPLANASQMTAYYESFVTVLYEDYRATAVAANGVKFLNAKGSASTPTAWTTLDDAAMTMYFVIDEVAGTATAWVVRDNTTVANGVAISPLATATVDVVAEWNQVTNEYVATLTMSAGSPAVGLWGLTDAGVTVAGLGTGAVVTATVTPATGNLQSIVISATGVTAKPADGAVTVTLARPDHSSTTTLTITY